MKALAGRFSQGRNDIKLTSHRETTETALSLELLDLTNSESRRNDDRLGNEAVLVTLNLPNHLGLVIGSAIVVNNAQTTEESHMNSHLVLSDSVHGRRHKRGFEGDTLGNGGIKGHLGRGESCKP